MSIKTKLRTNLMTPNELYYLKSLKRPILKKTILLEASHGREISGHIFSLAEKIKKDYPDFKIYIALRKETSVPSDFEPFIIKHMSKDYLKLLATCEYLINDTSFWGFFHKRKDQKYFIFWHGTPLKHLGKSTQVQGYGNVQRNLAAADKIFVSNEFTKEIIVQDFGIKDIVDNQIVVAPSPRNSSLFNNQVVPKRYLYMPTWRGVNVSDVSLSNRMLEELEQLDKLLLDDEEMYVKLHPYEAALLNFQEQGYQHLKPYPEETDLYHFLQTVEKLVTDYSSIMFDFAVTNREIVLFTFDEQEYQSERGMYLSVDELPFNKATTAQNLIYLLRESNKINYEKLQQNYTPYDSKLGTTIVLDYLLGDKKSQSIVEYSNSNGKENVLIYAYQLADNGITASLLNLMNTADLTKRNYILIWQEGMIPEELEYKIQQLPIEMYTFIQMKKIQATLLETAQTMLYMNQLPANKNTLTKMYQREFDRLFPNMKIGHFIHYPGYDRSYAVWTWALKPLGIQTSIFVHTDMEKEFKISPHLKPKIIFDAYEQADHVVCVSKPIEKKVLGMVPKANTIVMEVLLNILEVQRISEISLPETIPVSLLKDFSNDNITVFISVGRFSKQKGYDRLISAFEKLNNCETRLILVCSYGPEKAVIEEQIAKSFLKNNIYLFDNLVKPYNLIKQADAFVLSSRYEGLGMVVFESLAVETPVIMTNIEETLEVLEGNDKTLVVDNSTEGLVEGLEKFIKIGFKGEKFDFEKHEKESLQTWESLFSSK